MFSSSNSKLLWQSLANNYLPGGADTSEVATRALVWSNGLYPLQFTGWQAASSPYHWFRPLYLWLSVQPNALQASRNSKQGRKRCKKVLQWKQPALHAQDYKMLTCSSLQVDLDTLPFVAFHKGADVHHNRHGLSTSALWLRLQVLYNVAATFQTHINLPSPIKLSCCSSSGLHLHSFNLWRFCLDLLGVLSPSADCTEERQVLKSVIKKLSISGN